MVHTNVMSRKKTRTIDWGQFVLEQKVAYKEQQKRIPKKELNDIKASIKDTNKILEGRIKNIRDSVIQFHKLVKEHYGRFTELQPTIRKGKYLAKQCWSLTEKYKSDYISQAYSYIDNCNFYLHNLVSDEQVKGFLKEAEGFWGKLNKITWDWDIKCFNDFDKLIRDIGVLHKESVGMMVYDMQDLIIFYYWKQDEYPRLSIVVQLNKRWHNLITTQYKTQLETEKKNRLEYIKACKYFGYSEALSFWSSWIDHDNRRDMKSFRDRHTKEIIKDFEIKPSELYHELLNKLMNRYGMYDPFYNLMNELYEQEVKREYDFVGTTFVARPRWEPGLPSWRTINPGRMYSIMDTWGGDEPEAERLYYMFKKMFPSYYHTPLDIFKLVTCALIEDYNYVMYKSYVCCGLSSDEDNSDFEV